MKLHSRAKLLAPALLTAAALTGSLIPAATSAHPSKAAPIYLNTFQNFKTTLIRNFNPFDHAGQADFTPNGVYAPLMIVNVAPATNGKIFPYIATDYAWSNGNKTLTFTIRANAKWSDGQPLTAADVAFTFNYAKQYPVADQQGLWAKPAQLASVTASGDKVSFNLTSVNTVIFSKIANYYLIIPQHIWSKVTNPATFTNPNPVGAGPFTQVINFTPQSYTLGKNPYFWAPIAFDGLHVPSVTDNNAALLLATSGGLDMGGNFFPGCEKAFTSKDPAHFVCDYATVGPVGLWVNNQQYPYSLPAFRKALSNAIDRQKLYTIAEYGYETPADALGLLSAWPNWVDPSLMAQAKALAAYNPTAAKATLTAAGFTWKGGLLYDPKGHQVLLTLSVINGWSDWDLGMQLIQRDLKNIGIQAKINLMQQPQWFSQTATGTLGGGNGQLHWTNAGTTPYEFYYGFMSQESFTPIGTDATLTGQGNYERYFSAAATSALIDFRSTSDLAAQKAAMYKVEAIMLQDLPMIPLTNSADWSIYSTRHFTGFPNNANRYTSSSVNDGWGARLIVWQTIKPTGM
jgi:peptide/nickel transport system substrate-binding protein